MKRHKTPLHNRGRIKFDPQIQIGTKIYVQNLLEPSNGILNRFYLTRGSTLTSQDFTLLEQKFKKKIIPFLIQLNENKKICF